MATAGATATAAVPAPMFFPIVLDTLPSFFLGAHFFSATFIYFLICERMCNPEYVCFSSSAPPSGNELLLLLLEQACGSTDPWVEASKIASSFKNTGRLLYEGRRCALIRCTSVDGLMLSLSDEPESELSASVRLPITSFGALAAGACFAITLECWRRNTPRIGRLGEVESSVAASSRRVDFDGAAGTCTDCFVSHPPLELPDKASH